MLVLPRIERKGCRCRQRGKRVIDQCCPQFRHAFARHSRQPEPRGALDSAIERGRSERQSPRRYCVMAGPHPPAPATTPDRRAPPPPWPAQCRSVRSHQPPHRADPPYRQTRTAHRDSPTPRTKTSRVVPGSAAVIAASSSTKALNRVDFPAFGGPASTTRNPSRSGSARGRASHSAEFPSQG